MRLLVGRRAAAVCGQIVDQIVAVCERDVGRRREPVNKVCVGESFVERAEVWALQPCKDEGILARVDLSCSRAAGDAVHVG